MIVGCWVLASYFVLFAWWIIWESFDLSLDSGLGEIEVICVPRYPEASSFWMQYGTAIIIKNKCQTIQIILLTNVFLYFYVTTEKLISRLLSSWTPLLWRRSFFVRLLCRTSDCKSNMWFIYLWIMHLWLMPVVHFVYNKTMVAENLPLPFSWKKSMN